MTQIGGVCTRELAGRSSTEAEAISCNQGQWSPELSCGSPFDGTASELKKWPFMPAEDYNIEAHGHDHRDYGGGFAVGECGAEPVPKKGPWTGEEDEKLKKCVEEHGLGNWITIEKYSGLGRTSKSCRLRWINHLRPHLKKGSFTQEEERLLVKLHQIYGNKWSYIASKLPGRTDNEVKNFWHGRVRRCHRKFLPIYPESIDDDESCRNGLDIDGKSHLNDEYHSSPAMDDTGSILLFPSITSSEAERTLPYDACFQEQPNSMDNQNPPSTFTPPETQLFSPHQRPGSSPHGQSSSNLPSPTCYTTQMPASPMNLPSQNGYPSIQQFQSTDTSDTTPRNPLMSFQECCSSPQQSISKTAVTFTSLRPPPVLSSLVGQLKRSQRTCSPLSSPRTITQFSAAEQGSSISALGSSVTSLKMNVASPIPPTTPQLHSSKLHLSVEPPATSFEQLHTSSMPSDVCSSNLNSQNLNTNSIQTDSYLQKNQSATPSSVFPLAWDSLISEPPSVQTPTSAYRPTLEMKINQRETDVEILDAPFQEAKAEADILCQKSLEEQYVVGCLSLTKDPVGNLLENGTFNESVSGESSRQGGFFCERTRRLNELGPSLKLEHAATEMSNTRDLVKCRKISHNKCFKPEALMGKISRREGLLSEISKTGVLLVERGKKETILQGLLDKSSTLGNLTSKRSKTEDVELGEISKRGKFLGENFIMKESKSEMYNKKDSVDQNTVEDASLCENFAGLRYQNHEEILLGISSRRSISPNLQKQTRDQDAFGEVSCAISRGNDMLASRGQEDEYKTLDPAFSHGTEIAVLKSGDKKSNLKYSAPTKAILNESIKEECPDTLEGGSLLHQAQSGDYIGEDLLVDGLFTSQDQQEILYDSVWGLDQYTSTNPLCLSSPDRIWSSVQPCGDDLFGAAARKEVSSGRSWENEVCPDNGSRERFPLESSTERTITLHKLNKNEFVSSTSKSAAAHLVTTRTHCGGTGSGQCKKEQKTKQEMEAACNTLPEDLSNLLEFIPTNIVDWYDMSCETLDMSYETLEHIRHDFWASVLR